MLYYWSLKIYAFFSYIADLEEQMKKSCILMLNIFLATLTFGQDAAKITEILETSQLTRAQASYLAATWINPAHETLEYEQAAQVMVNEGFFKEGVDMNEPITLAELSGLFVKTWNVPGGLFYRLSKSNRYAFRELKARGFISSQEDPSFFVTGAQGLNIMYKCMEVNNSTIIED